MTTKTITKIVADYLGHPEVDVKPESKFVADLGADSLDVVDMCLVLEDEFDLEIPDAEVTSLHSVGDVVAWLERQPAKA